MLNLLNGLMDVVKLSSCKDNLTPKQVVEIATNVLNDDEFKDALAICIKYYRGKQMKGELKNDGMGNIKRK